MAGYGGQELVPSNETTEWMEQCRPASVLFPVAFSSEAFAPDLHRRELGPIQELEQRCTPLQAGPSSLDNTVSLLKERLKASLERQSPLSNDLINSIARRLWHEMHSGKEREAELLQEHSEFEAQIVEWKRLFSMALASYQENEEEIRIMQIAQEEVDRAVNAQLEEMQTELAIKQAELDEKVFTIVEKDFTIAEKDFTIEDKDRTILALEEDKHAFMQELVYVINGTITTFWNISEQVLDLAADLQKFQRRHKKGEMTTVPRARPCQEMPSTLLSCGEEVAKKINYAKSALDEAFKEWKKAEAGLEMMQSHERKRLLATILGKEEAAVSHAVKAKGISQ